MNEYKKKTDEIHAPKELIAATLNRIHEEEKNQKSEKVVSIQRKRRIGISSFATVAAAAVILFGLHVGNNAQMNLIYNTVPDTIVRTLPEEQTDATMSVEEYSDYLGLDIQHPVADAKMIKSEIHVIYDKEIITKDEGTVYYNVNGKPMMIQFSKTLNIMPEHLITGEPSKVNGQTIFAAVNESGRNRMAAFEREGITCFLMSTNMEQPEFEAFLSEFFKNLKK